MGRPRRFTDAELLVSYNKTQSTHELAEVLGISTVSAYKHLRRLRLNPKTLGGRPDLRSFDDAAFRQAYAKSSSFAEVAVSLGCTQQTARKHAKRLGLNTFGHRPDIAGAIKIFEQYRATVTIKEIAAAHNITPSQVRGALDRAINQVWRAQKKTPTLPTPDCHGQIKLYHLFSKHPSAASKPLTELAQELGLKEPIVARYVARMKKKVKS